MNSQSLRLLGDTRPISSDDDNTTSLLERQFCTFDNTRDGSNYFDVQIPIERSMPRCNSEGLVEGQVQRIGSTVNRRKYLMSLQRDHATMPLFIAEKEQPSHTLTTGAKSQFLIRNFDDDSIVGFLTKTGTARDTTIAYALIDRTCQECPVAHIRYQVPSVLQVLTRGPLRRASMEVPGRVFAESEDPKSKDGDTKKLNFRGRGREASRKNMQLKDRDGRAVLQFVKWEQDVFHLDYTNPFNAYHAFAFALAQFDL